MGYLKLSHIERLGIGVSGLILILIMALVTLEVFFRYAFNAPLEFTYELIGVYLLAAAALLGLADVQRLDGHIAVDVIYINLPEKLQRGIAVVTLAISSAFAALVTYVSYEQLVERWVNEKVLVGWTLWPLWITSAFVVFGFGFLTIRTAVQSVRMAVGTEPLPKGEVEHTLEAQSRSESS